jgi:hypothetical protein
MAHFIAYHKIDEWGEYSESGGTFRHYSGKPRSTLQRMIGETVWVISGRRLQRQKIYKLEAVFTPSKIREQDSGRTISGRGRSFSPSVDITPLAWLEALLFEQGNFRFGLNQTQDARVIAGLLALRDGEPVDGLAEEISDSASLFEGASRQIFVNAYERNQIARRKCIEHYGPICKVCEFDFGAVYGEIGQGFIHVHHLKDLSTIGARYEVNPIADLRPVCPNCHAMLHRTVPAMTLARLKRVIVARRACD